MLGRLLRRTSPEPINDLTNGAVDTRILANGTDTVVDEEEHDWRANFEQIDWVDPNKKNLVAEGDVLCDPLVDLSNT